jgi:hypothetical protein
MSLRFSYQRLGLSTKPLTIYTAGGVEKNQREVAGVIASAPVTRPRRSEGTIKHYDDGSTSVVYPDSDDELELPQQSAEEEIDVIKGSVFCE